MAVDVNGQWDTLQEHMRTSKHPAALWRGIRWVLVQSFGDEMQYAHDAEFHARVHAAEQMLVRLVEIAEESRDN